MDGIPAKLVPACLKRRAGIQKRTGFRNKPGITSWLRLVSSCILSARMRRSPLIRNLMAFLPVEDHRNDVVGAVQFVRGGALTA